MSTGQWVLLVAVVATLCLGVHRAWADGRFRGTHPLRGAEPTAGVELVEDRPSLLAGTAYAASLGEWATLLQFSTAFCAPCRATRHILADVASRTPGVAHVEVDAEQHLELVRRLGILRTPTTLVLNADGHEVTRAAGAPRREQVHAALTRAAEGRIA